MFKYPLVDDMATYKKSPSGIETDGLLMLWVGESKDVNPIPEIYAEQGRE